MSERYLSFPIEDRSIKGVNPIVMIIRKYLTALFLLLSVSAVHSQSRFSLDLTKDAVIGTAALGVVIPSFFLDSGPADYKDISEINSLDRNFVYGFNPALDKTSSVLVAASLVLPGALMLNSDLRGSWLTYGVMYAEAFALTMGTKDILKGTVSRNRPYTYKDSSIPEGEEDDYYNSFPSGHTAYAFLGATFLTTTLLYDAPDSKWTAPLIIGAYTAAASVGGLRVASGSHFVTDVLAGAAIGSFFGWLVPTLHLQKSDEIEVLAGPQSLSFKYTY